jgi:glycosyltransferase involved in cell wall biosynthesis
VDRIILANPPMGLKPYKNRSTITIENFPKIKYLTPLQQIKKRTGNHILYHGHIGPERGLKELVCAMKQVVGIVPSASLNIVGTFRTKNFENNIRNLIEELDLQKSVMIAQQVPHSQIWGIINKHRVGVIPFRRTPLTEENTPTKLFEMMICGLELVVSKLPPAQFFLNNSVHWCDPDNINSISESLISALNVKDNLSNVHENQRLIIEKYNWEKKQKDYLTLFKS